MEQLEILCSPFHKTCIRETLSTKLASFQGMISELSVLDCHPALFLLRNCFSIPRLIYFLRSAPCYIEVDILNAFDSSIRSSADSICKVNLDISG